MRAMEAAAATLTGGDHVGRIEAYVSQVNTNYEAVAQKVRDALKSGDKIIEAWLPLKDLKESNPVQVAKFAKARGLD